MRILIDQQQEGGPIAVTLEGQAAQTVQSPEEALQLVGQALGIQGEEEQSDLGRPVALDNSSNGLRPPVNDRSQDQRAWDEEAHKAA